MEKNRNYIIAISTDGQGIVAMCENGLVSNQIPSSHLFLPEEESQGTLTVAMCDGNIVAFNYSATNKESDAEGGKKVLVLSSSAFCTIVDSDNDICEAVVTFVSDRPISIDTNERDPDFAVPVALGSIVAGIFIGMYGDRYNDQIVSWIRSLW